MKREYRQFARAAKQVGKLLTSTSGSTGRNYRQTADPPVKREVSISISLVDKEEIENSSGSGARELTIGAHTLTLPENESMLDTVTEAVNSAIQNFNGGLTCAVYVDRNRICLELMQSQLGKNRVIRALTQDEAQQKASAEVEKWCHAWLKESYKTLSKELTHQAQTRLQELDRLLIHVPSREYQLDWDSLKEREQFPKRRPAKPDKTPIPPRPEPNAKVYDWRSYRPFDILSWFMSTRRERLKAMAIEKARARLQEDTDSWQEKVKEAHHEDERKRQELEKELSEWENRKQEFLNMQAARNQAIDIAKEGYEKGEREGVIEFSRQVLRIADWSKSLLLGTEIDFKPEAGILVVDAELSSPKMIPRLREVKYVATRNALEEVSLSEKDANKLYDTVVYQVCLGTLYLLFKADKLNRIDSIALNGWVRSIDPAKGKEVYSCIVTIHVMRDAFDAIDLSKVDPKTCFKSLKGVGSSKLHSLAAVAPLVRMDKSDSRFVEGYAVADTLDDAVNVAAIDWQDFEHLIREVFEKEFSSSGGEVKITQASRDRGVDAVAFDPDPIRGGKIVIQAKRYTNVVGVDAVRDLYGTVINEGATKGILITTSDYGPDSYDFAKDKPLTLLNGSNLLYLLEKHGHKAKIDLKEAKKMLSEE